MLMGALKTSWWYAENFSASERPRVSLNQLLMTTPYADDDSEARRAFAEHGA
jgi:hypothetical protein